MIEVTDNISLDESELEFDFVRSSGPGGQNVNKVATAVQRSFDLMACETIPDDVAERLARIAGRRLTKEGVLVINANRFRTQERNRQDAVDRLVEMIREAAVVPRKRRKTRPPASARANRLDAKRRRSQKKQLRGSVAQDDD